MIQKEKEEIVSCNFMDNFESRGMWIDIHIGNDVKKEPIFSKKIILIYPNFSCGSQSLQEYFLQHESDISHKFIHKLMEVMKELDGIDIYRQAALKLKKLGIKIPI